MQEGSTRPRRILQTRPRDVRGIPWVRRGFARERYAGRRQKARPDPVAPAVDRLTAVAPRGDVVDGAGKLDAQGAGHAGMVAEGGAKDKT